MAWASWRIRDLSGVDDQVSWDGLDCKGFSGFVICKPVIFEYYNPKGDADTERVMRTVKEECLWPKEWTCPFELIRVLEACITSHNEH